MDRLEHELEGQARVMRFSLFSSVGQELAHRYGVRGVPTFLIFNGQGDLVGREVGLPDRSRIRALVAGD